MNTARRLPVALGSSRRREVLSFAAAVLALGAAVPARADTYTFNLGTTPQPWNNAASWTNTTGGTGTFPNAAGDVANLVADITATQQVNLNQNITIGTLNIGDIGASAPNLFTIATGTGTNTLTFQGATTGAATAINVTTAGTAGVANTIGTAVVLGGTSPLTITANGLQTLSFASGSSLNVGANTLTVSTTNTGSGGGIALNTVTGTGALVKNGVGRAFLNGAASTFSGAVTINAGALTSQNGAQFNSTNVTINTTGTFEIGSNQPAAIVNSAAGITLNGGTVAYRGSSTAGATTQSFNTVALAQGNSTLAVTASAATNQSVLSIGTLSRSAGAVLQVQGVLLGQAAGTAGSTRVLAGNAPGLVGGSGAAGSTTVSIVPWAIGSSNATAGGGVSTVSDLITYDATNGFRPLATAEYAALGAGTSTANNVTTAAATVGTTTTLNALRITGGTVAISTGQALNVTSGTLLFSNAGTLAGPGTVNFGTAEGVVSSVGANSPTIGAAVAGSGGFTKGGTGLLTLTAVNTYSGVTTVAGGTLLTGATGNFGAGNTVLARGATLTLGNNASLGDTFSLILNSVGTVNLNYTGSETVGALSLDFGTTFLTPGTYSVADLNALGQTTFATTLSGTLTIAAVPEIAEWKMIAIGAAMFAALRLRNLRRRTA